MNELQKGVVQMANFIKFTQHCLCTWYKKWYLSLYFISP